MFFFPIFEGLPDLQSLSIFEIVIELKCLFSEFRIVTVEFLKNICRNLGTFNFFCFLIRDYSNSGVFNEFFRIFFKGRINIFGDLFFDFLGNCDIFEITWILFEGKHEFFYKFFQALNFKNSFEKTIVDIFFLIFEKQFIFFENFHEVFKINRAFLEAFMIFFSKYLKKHSSILAIGSSEDIRFLKILKRSPVYRRPLKVFRSTGSL